jgi:hypothetical protein
MFNDEPYLIEVDGRALRSCEPRYNAQVYQWRSTYALMPDHPHASGAWWRLESYAHFVAAEYAPLVRTRFGYTVSVLVQMFHQTNGKADKNNPDAGLPAPSSAAGAPAPAPAIANPAIRDAQAQAIIDQDDAPEADPEALGPLPDEQPDIRPDWSSFDLGTALRALRSDQEQIRVRALRRLHIRWFHCSARRMEELLLAAGVQPGVANQCKDIVATCRVCRLWMRPKPSTVGASRLSTTFNKTLQHDLLFFETHIVCHLICEATRFSVAFEISDRSAASILEGMCTNWFRVFGPPEMIVSDREGSLTSEEASLFGEHWNVLFKFKAKGSHAQVVERHHEIIRQTFHRVKSQSLVEGLQIDDDDII